MISVTLIIVIATCAISLIYMQNQEFKSKFMFNAYAIKHRNEWWRWFTGGFLHADMMHLIFNMVTLWYFGSVVELTMSGNSVLNQEELDGNFLWGHGVGSLMYFLMYMSAIPLSSVFTYFKNKDNPYYNALGASGAVSAVVYSFILFAPLRELTIFFAIPATSWIYGIIYLVISWTMARRNIGNIGHDAHFFGSLYGFIFPIVFFPFLAENFVSQLVGSLVG
jgi:membrane associated rhomboid family serine protease